MKQIIPFILALLMTIGVASAIMIPMPISLHIKNEGVLSGYDVEFVNQRTGETVIGTTDGQGFVLVDWSNTELKWIPGDRFDITIKQCSGVAECNIEKTISPDANPIYFVVDLTDAVCPVCPKCSECEDCEKCPTVICPDCPDVNVDCPDIPVCDECEECEECPQNIFEALLLLVAFVLGIPAGGVSLFYFNKRTNRWKKVTDERVADGTVKKEAN